MNAWKCNKCGHGYNGPQRPCPECSKPEHSFAAPPCSAAIPRRIRIDQYTPAEKAIAAAIEAVELAGCHELLTDAVNLLSQAKSKVADFVELPMPMKLWKAGDIVTRDGTGEHVIVDIEGHDPSDCMLVRCVKEPSEPWAKIGEEESSLLRRYSWLRGPAQLEAKPPNDQAHARPDNQKV